MPQFNLTKGAAAAAAGSLLHHPYFPVSTKLPHYTAPTMSMSLILTYFFGTVAVILAGSWAIASANRLSFNKKLLFLWFVSCGFIHSVLEGYFAYHNKEIAGQSFILAELWKEYANSDSRYMSSDVFVVIMEAITAVFWGSLSFVSAYGILVNAPWTPILTFLVSTGQLYGDVLYYATTLYEGAPHCSSSPFHFWFYFVTLNAFWIVIPGAIMWSSAKTITKAVAVVQGQTIKAKGKRA
ncbi:emopamil binding protein [Phlyctochytrium arcticum]|nr:emopamil binding protein [Phlyctochytrium arcticum]